MFQSEVASGAFLPGWALWTIGTLFVFLFGVVGWLVKMVSSRNREEAEKVQVVLSKLTQTMDKLAETINAFKEKAFEWFVTQANLDATMKAVGARIDEIAKRLDRFIEKK
jgi:methyl-accepting chemotaxis protein